MTMKHNNDPRTEGPTNWDVTRTIQSAEAETNINNIMKRAKRTGELTHISTALGAYRDVSGIPDLHEALNIVTAAASIFEELPGEVRAVFNHDVGNFLPYYDDPRNLEEMVDLGLRPASDLPKTVPSTQPEEGNITPTEPASS